ncbi:MAG: hypothetical protein JWL96_3641 [Sphingomonas bacterium]|uniref:trypsin-like serine peptidase n=1 Tax=Sphingomonas bacterium TaxID=1895847 RepID=UPI0026061CD6|nr:hypothetical protein [Sphingomonas bacterium]MDB5711571.1 hypothetical protein [Sphingomonas bacterium]
MPQAGDPNTVVSRSLLANFSAVLKNMVLPEILGIPADRDAVEEYWTAERIAGAKPFPLRALPRDPAPGLIDQEQLKSLLRGFGKRSRNKSSPPPDAESAWFKALVAPPFDTERVPNRGAFPYSAIGKMVAQVGGNDFAGTAWVVGDRAIVTAGHCLFDDNSQQWATHVAFMPQFDDQPARGIWYGASSHTLSGWTGGGPNAAAFDLGAVILEQPIASTTGTIGWRANIAANQQLLQAVGYPSDWVSAAYDFDGKHMWSCNGNYVGGSSVIGMNNNMTRGSSGGPWLKQDPQGRIFACGLNSHYNEDHSNVMYSPYFGQGIINLIRAVG